VTERLHLHDSYVLDLGGRGNLAQGGGKRVELLDEALARAATAVRSK